MKLSDLHETVIDFAAARAAKNKSKSSDSGEISLSSDDVDNLGYKKGAEESTHGDHLDLLMDHIKQIQATLKLPAFGSLQSVMMYLSDIGAIQETKLPSEWFNSIPQEDKSKVRMIAHHSDRIIKMITSILAKLAKFKAQLPKDSSVNTQVDKFISAYKTYLDSVTSLNSLA
jgi:hypothetical protein